MSSPEIQIQSQCSLTFILFIHSWKNKQSGLRQGWVVIEGGAQERAGTTERQLALSLPSASFRLTWHPPAAWLETLNRGFSRRVKRVSSDMCVLVWVSHLAGHRWTHLCSSASAAGSTCAERRCTAMLGRLERAGQTGTCTKAHRCVKFTDERKRKTYSYCARLLVCRYSRHQRKEGGAEHSEIYEATFDYRLLKDKGK